MTNFKLKNIQFPSSLEALQSLPEGKLLINTINAHSYNIARTDKEFAEALLKGDVLLPDGASIVWAMKWLQPPSPQMGEQERKRKIERIAGWDLFVWEMNRIQQKSVETSCMTSLQNVMFLGSTEEVLTKIKASAAIDYPNIRVHTYSPPYKPEFSKEDNDAMIAAVNAIEPDLLWIGMTAPKQEKWAYKYFDQLNVKGHIGTIGAVFDFYAGTVERAPLWWQRNSLEWLYRLIKEPRRMWRRYLIGNVKFVWAILGER